MPADPPVDRTAVLDVAARLADERGYPTLTLAMLAAELGIRSQSLYAHVDGIAGLRDGLALLGQAMLADDLRDAAMARTRSDALRSVVHAMADFADTHPGWTKRVFVHPTTRRRCGRPANAPSVRSWPCWAHSAWKATIWRTTTGSSGPACTGS